MNCTVAIPCRTDEPALGRTLAQVWEGWRVGGGSDAGCLEVLVCLNGPDVPNSRAHDDLVGFATGHGCAVVRAEAEVGDAVGDAVVVRLVVLAEPGKARAWNALRRHVRTDVVLFADADVSIGDGTVGRLLSALAGAPDAILATPRTGCLARDTWFESVMAAPYGVAFPNLSGQLYAARTDALPPAMPETLIEPERWLELVVGPTHVLHVADAHVLVRLPGTFRDFVRQRVRIEMGKVQLRRDLPGLLERSAPQPGLRAALRGLGLGALVRLGIYLMLRAGCHAIAALTYRSRESPTRWPQAASTKRWEMP